MYILLNGLYLGKSSGGLTFTQTNQEGALNFSNTRKYIQKIQLTNFEEFDRKSGTQLLSQQCRYRKNIF